jgi:hypothetical protein
MDERLRFVARLLDGEKMVVLCRSSISLPRRDVLPAPPGGSLGRWLPHRVIVLPTEI